MESLGVGSRPGFNFLDQEGSNLVVFLSLGYCGNLLIKHTNNLAIFDNDKLAIIF